VKRLILALLILAVSSSACGESWILWSKDYTSYKKPFPPIEGWIIYEVYGTLKECSKDRKNCVDTLKKTVSAEMKNGEISNYTVGAYSIRRSMNPESDKMWEIEAYYCLPGTLDPREKK